MIKNKIKPQSKLSFTSVQYEDVLRKIKSKNVRKVSQISNFPTKILKENCKYFTCIFMKI